MDARAKMVRDILHAADQYLVPFFQRHYAWTQKHWERLYNDVLALQEDDQRVQHFLGPLVCTPFKHVPGEVTPYQLIDGQQRLSTLMVMLAAFRDLARDRKCNDLADEIAEDYLVHRRQKGVQRYKVLPRLGDREAFFAVIDGGDVAQYSDYSIVKAWQYYRDNFNGYILEEPEKKLRSLFHTVTARLSLVVITIDGENPYEIFESLNSTGLPLEESDLIRNYIFMQIPIDDQEGFHISHWQPLEKMFDETDEYSALSQTAFYRSYLMRNGAYSKDKATYIDFKSQNKERQLSPVDQANELKLFAQFENWLRRPKTCPISALSKALSQIQMLDITTAHPLLMHLLEMHASKKLELDSLLGCLDDISSFIIRRTICGETTRPYGRWFPDAVKAIRKDTRLDLQNYWLSRGWPDDDTFISRLLEFSLYRRETGKCRMILQALEESHGHREKVELANLEIEHVMPQTIGGGKSGQSWQEDLGENWRDIHEKWLHTIGNLTLSGYNRPLGNKPYKEKRMELIKSKLELNRYFSDIKKWTEEEIKKRGRLLAKKIVKIWPRPAGAAYVPSEDIDTGELSPKERGDLRSDYWSNLLKVVKERNVLPELPDSTRLGFLMFDPGWEGIKLFAYTERWNNTIGVYLRFRKKRAKKSYKKILEMKDQITEKFGKQSCWWQDNPKKNNAYVGVAFTGVDPANREQWDEQHKWLTNKLEEFYKYFDPLLKEQ